MQGQEPTATLTLDAYQRLKAELEELTTTRREEITEKIKVAREHGDLKENAEYHAAKDEQGMMESRIRKVQHMLRDPDIVEAPTEADAVGPGMLVTVKPLDFDEEDDETYLIAEHAEEKAPGARTVTTRLAVRVGARGHRDRRRGRVRGAGWHVPVPGRVARAVRGLSPPDDDRRRPPPGARGAAGARHARAPQERGGGGRRRAADLRLAVPRGPRVPAVDGRQPEPAHVARARVQRRVAAS